MPVPFLDLTREWRHFEAKLEGAFEKFGRAGFYVLGPASEEFENHFAAVVGYKYAVTVATGLAALKVALLAKGVKSGDEVITVANSAVATSLAISQIGARPVFADIKDDFLMDENKIAPLITPRTRAILPVHLFGRPADLTAIGKIAAKHNLLVIEDAAQAAGADFGPDGKINTKAFSFYPTKNLGAIGEGGLIATNDEGARDFAKQYRNYGQAGRYEHVIKGDNLRLSALTAALLDVKLPALAELVARRRQIARKYVEALAPLSGLNVLPFDPAGAYHLFVIRILNGRRDALKAHLEKNGVETLIHYPTPIHQQPCYRQEYPDLILEKTDTYQKEILSLPCYPFLEPEEQDEVIAKIKGFFL